MPWNDKVRIDPATGCHIWLRARQSRGYGVVWFDGRVRLAHRVAWFLKHGRWPAADLVLDHICEVKACVNADHLRELPNWQNVRRGRPVGDVATEHRREDNRRAHAKHRGTYSASYQVERGGSNTLA